MTERVGVEGREEPPYIQFNSRNETKRALTASMTGPPFFFCVPCLFAKKDPKKLGSSFLNSTSRSLLLLIWPGASFPVFGSAWGGGGLFAFRRSCTIAIALWPFKKSGCVVLT